MFVESFKNNGIPYLRLVRNDRVTNKNGVRTATKKVILNIGPLSRFDDGQPDYVDRLKKSFKAGTPLIPALLPYCSKEQPAENYPTQMQEGSPECLGHPRLFSHVLLERILEELGLNTFFSSYKGFTKLQYDVYGFAKLLTFGRLLNPASKVATVRQNNDYYEPVLAEGFNPDNVYDTLTFIYENKDKIIRRINTNLVSELTMAPQDVIEKYHGLTQIEDQFRVMKSGLEARPFHVRTPEHMEAHVLICMISLIMLRLIQKRIIRSGLVNVDKQAFWNTGLSCERIQQALNKWKVDLMPADLYRFMDVDDPDLKLILDAFDIKIPLKLYRKAELKALKKNIKIFM